jgi:hypothetical protein
MDLGINLGRHQRLRVEIRERPKPLERLLSLQIIRNQPQLLTKPRQVRIPQPPKWRDHPIQVLRGSVPHRDCRFFPVSHWRQGVRGSSDAQKTKPA